MTKQREHAGERMIDDDPDQVNVLPFVDQKEARNQLVNRLESDDEDIVDIDTSDSYDFATELRSDFKSHLE